MTEDKQHILIAGANGSTGKIIVDILKDSEAFEPIAMIRKEEQTEQFEKDNVKTVLADLEKDVSHALKGIDKVIFAAGSKGRNVIGVDQEGAKKLIDAGEQADIKKFVMLSSIGADKPWISDDLEDYLKAKLNADDHLRDSNLDYSIVRPGRLTDEDGTGKIKLEEKLDNYGDISRADVARTLVEVLADDKMKNQVFELIEGDTSIEEAISN
jgi:uncharacterized protein YbjT (DUF2867 family)